MRRLGTALCLLGLVAALACDGRPSSSASAGGISDGSTGSGTSAGASGGSGASSLAALRGAAAREGDGFELYAPSSLNAEYVPQLQDAFNKKYGLNVTFKYTPSGSMTRDAARVLTEIAAGQPPTWDIMLMTDAQYATLYNNDALEKTDWAALGVTNQKAILYDGTSAAFATQFGGPVYNASLVRPDEAPKDWNDLLDPRWHGKLGVSTATHHLARLAQVWGDERTTRFVEGLAAQQPVLGRLQELQTRLQLGEIALLSSTYESLILDARRAGAPLQFADTVKPIIAAQTNAGVIKSVRRPNLARLMAAFLLSPEGQALWQEAVEESSMFIDGSPAFQYAQGKDVLVLDARFPADQLEPLTEKYGRMVGYR
jgi:ABC-type Fe3+ transport system substrate-binding protein